MLNLHLELMMSHIIIMLNKLKNIIWVIFFGFCSYSCSQKRLYGLYKSSYGWHYGQGRLLEIKSGSTKYIGQGGSLEVMRKQSNDTIYLYSDSFFNQSLYNKDLSEFLKQQKDTLKALDLFTQNLRGSYQMTNNDSVDVLIFEKGNLYLINREGKSENYFYKLRNRREKNYNMHILGY